MKIKKVTVTGADNSVPPSALLEIAREFPFVEFGILLSRVQMGRNRFPSGDWIRKAMRLPPAVHLSGHVCGAWVREILVGKWPYAAWDGIFGPEWFSRFDRFQLNTHGERHKWAPEFLPTIGNVNGVIFQNDGEHDDLIAAAVDSPNVSALFDLSHGAGVLPDDWPRPLDSMPCGYAGGLSPANVAEQCGKLAELVGDAEIWIDAQTHLREPESQFDLDKVRAFLAAAAPWV